MSTRLPLQHPPRKICILRLSALGDVTHVVPVVRALQQQWPGAEITWVCGSFESRLLENLDGVRLLRFNKKGGWRAYLDIWRNLRTNRFDVLLQMQVSARANLLSLGIRADIRLGWDRARSRDLHGLCINQRIPGARQQHQVLAFLSFAQALGVEVDQPLWDFPLPADEQAFVEAHVRSDRRTLIISPGSSHALRNWSVEGYAAIADYAVQKHGFRVLLCGGPSEAELELARQIESTAQTGLVNLTGKDTLQQLIALINASDVMISPDSGPLHIANALGKPVIGLYACTWSRRSGPFNSLRYCVDCFPQAAQRFLGKKPDQLRWGSKIEQRGVMQMIQIEQVREKLDLLVKDLA